MIFATPGDPGERRHQDRKAVTGEPPPGIDATRRKGRKDGVRVHPLLSSGRTNLAARGVYLENARFPCGVLERPYPPRNLRRPQRPLAMEASTVPGVTTWHPIGRILRRGHRPPASPRLRRCAPDGRQRSGSKDAARSRTFRKCPSNSALSVLMIFMIRPYPEIRRISAPSADSFFSIC